MQARRYLHVLEGYPRDELFQVDQKTLLQNSQQILRLNQRPRVRVLPRVDKFDRFVSCLVYVPRDRYDTSVRIKIGDYLKDVFDGRISSVYPDFPDGPMARVHYIIGRSEGKTPSPSRNDLEQTVTTIIRTWFDGLCNTLRDHHPIKKASQLINRYSDAFSDAYQDTFEPDIAVHDIKIMECMNSSVNTAIQFYHKENAENHHVALKIFHQENPIPLSKRVPILENMGFRVIDERSYSITPQGADRALLDA